jgi:RNA polymerase sigma-70 factor (ECF subfamily)
MTPASTYARFAPFVRRRLADLGVREADLPDLCQEVFVVVHGKRDVLAAVDRTDLWLAEICRRLAAGYRRRAGHRLEVLGAEAEDRAAGCWDVDEADAGGQLALLRRALNHLDDESRDLLALHHGGEMPLSALARLVEHDRKTVSSRLSRARRRVSRWLCGDDGAAAGLPETAPVRATPPQSPFMQDKAARGRAAGCAARELAILRVEPELCSGVDRKREHLRLARPGDHDGDHRRRRQARPPHRRGLRRGDRLPRRHRTDPGSAFCSRSAGTSPTRSRSSAPTWAASRSCCSPRNGRINQPILEG